MKPPSSLSMEEMMVSSSSSTRPPQQLVERRARPQKEQAFSCPRCNSTNTKFCYYNNYSLTQPRYFCKTCRRYWTEGGSLRNVPVGGGSRKNKRSSSSSLSGPSSSANSTTSTSLLTTSAFHSSIENPNSKKLAVQQNPKFHDLNLGFPNLVGDYGDRLHQFQSMNMNMNMNMNMSMGMNMGGISNNPSSSSSTNADVNANAALSVSAMEVLRSSSGILNPFVPLPIVHEHESSAVVYPRPSPSGPSGPSRGGGGGGFDQNNVQDGAGGSAGDSRLLFPFENLRQVSSTNPSEHHEFDQSTRGQGGDSSAFWNGAMGGGGTAW